MKKILSICKLPDEVVAKYKDEFTFVFPEGDAAFTNAEITERIPGISGYLGFVLNKAMLDRADQIEALDGITAQLKGGVSPTIVNKEFYKRK